MQRAILFWFYKSFDVCENRLRRLRKLNGRDVPIYGLFGGPRDDVAAAAARLSPYLDDFYAYPGEESAHWKWLNGDRLIAAWARDRGGSLPWDTVIVVQWDMLMFRPISSLFSSLRPGELVLSGFRPESEIRQWWGWLGDRIEGAAEDREAFRRWLRDTQNYAGELWCCLFIVVALPRTFLDRYLDAGPPEAGFLEYKLPTLARAFGLPVSSSVRYDPWWGADPNTRDAPGRARTLRAMGGDVALLDVLAEAADPRRRGIVHPFGRVLPLWLTAPPVTWALACWLRFTQAFPRLGLKVS